MAKKHTPKTPDEHLSALLELLNHFKEHIHTDKLRDKVLGLIPAHTLLRGIGTSLMGENKSSASPTAGGIYVTWGAKRQKIRTARGYAGCSFIMRGEIVLSGSSTI